MGKSCYAFGTAGNDIAGKIACESLKSSGINIDNISIETSKGTNINHIVHYPNKTFTDSRYSPLTKKCTVQFSDQLPTTIPADLQNKTIYIVLSRMFPINLKFIKNIRNKIVCLDIGSSGTIRDLNQEYLTDFLSYINVLLLNKNVTSELLNKLNLPNILALYNRLSLDLLIETNGINPVNFIFTEDCLPKALTLQPHIVNNPLDTVGAGDAFFSVIINAYSFCQEHEIKIDSTFVRKIFPLANNLSAEIVKIRGCRGTSSIYKQWANSFLTKDFSKIQQNSTELCQ